MASHRGAKCLLYLCTPFHHRHPVTWSGQEGWEVKTPKQEVMPAVKTPGPYRVLTSQQGHGESQKLKRGEAIYPRSHSQRKAEAYVSSATELSRTPCSRVLTPWMGEVGVAVELWKTYTSIPAGSPQGSQAGFPGTAGGGGCLKSRLRGLHAVYCLLQFPVVIVSLLIRPGHLELHTLSCCLASGEILSTHRAHSDSLGMMGFEQASWLPMINLKCESLYYLTNAGFLLDKHGPWGKYQQEGLFWWERREEWSRTLSY